MHDDIELNRNKLLRKHISLDKVNEVLDKYIDEEYITDEDIELLLLYTGQLLVRSNRNTVSIEDIQEKANALIDNRKDELLFSAGLAEVVWNIETNQFEMQLKEF